MLKIYGANLSTPANKVRFVANKLGLDYEYVEVSIRDGENRKEEYLKLNPSGKVPAIDDNGFTLFESNAICKYLCCKYKSDLYPQCQEERAVIDQWIDFISMHINAAMGRVFFNRIVAKIANMKVDERSLEDGLTFLAKFLPIVDKQLEGKEYITGENLTLADIVLLASLDPCEVAKFDIEPYKNISRLRNKLKGEGFYKKCFDDYSDVLRKMKAKQ